MDQSPVSRRALIGGASVAVVALAVPSPAAAVPDAFPAEWHALIAEYRRINADAKAAGDRFNAAERAYAEQRQPEPAKKHRPSLISEDMTIAQIKAMPLELFERDDDAEWQVWKAGNDALHDRIVDPANDAWSKALSDADAAMTAVQAYPSTSPAMLAEKVCLLAEHYGSQFGNDADELVAILADARRLSGREG